MNHEIKSYDEALAFLEGEKSRLFHGDTFEALFTGAEGSTISVSVKGLTVLQYKPNGNIVILPKSLGGYSPGTSAMSSSPIFLAVSTLTPYEFSGNEYGGYEIDTGKDVFMLYPGMEVEPSGWLMD